MPPESDYTTAALFDALFSTPMQTDDDLLAAADELFAEFNKVEGQDHRPTHVLIDTSGAVYLIVDPVFEETWLGKSIGATAYAFVGSGRGVALSDPEWIGPGSFDAKSTLVAL